MVTEWVALLLVIFILEAAHNQIDALAHILLDLHAVGVFNLDDVARIDIDVLPLDDLYELGAGGFDRAVFLEVLQAPDVHFVDWVKAGRYW